jgi:phosphoribosylglycinamide formyltransferase-1
MVKINTCVFISGTGSNLKYLIKNSREYNFPIKIAQVYTNKKNAPGLIYAKKYSIPFKVINMKILSKKFIKNFNGKIINIHPSLLPKYKGINTFSRILKNKEKITGCTVHHVNAELDSGNIILKKSFNILKNENEKSLRKKTQNFEYRAFSEAIIKLFR